MNVAHALQQPTAVAAPTDVRWMHTLTRVLAWALGVLVLAIVGAWAARQPMFQITQIRLDGDLSRNNKPTVQVNVAPHLQGPQARYFTVDLLASQQVFAALPWVRQAVVRRVWPNGLHVTLQEHQAAAYWQTGEREDQMVNTHGEVFEANTGDVDDAGLPTFVSPSQATAEQASHMLTMYRSLTTALAPLNERIDTLQLSDRGSWQLKMDSGARMELGRGEDTEVLARVERFVRTFPHFSAQLHSQYPTGLLYADLRYPRGYAVRMRGITTMQTLNEAASVMAPATSPMPLNPSTPH